MKHLFIVNPAAEGIRGKKRQVLREIDSFYESNPKISIDVHVTRWARDASGYIRRYAQTANELVRVHTFGGSGTLFEVVNGVIGLPNAQIAAYPMGRSNYFLRYFGEDKLHLFSSLRNQAFSGVTSIDAVRCGSNFGISHGLVGAEAASGRDGVEMIEKTHLPADFCYLWSVSRNTMFGKNTSQFYKITLDGQVLDGDYISVMIANGPCCGKRMIPAVDAHPNDGKLDVYLVKNVPKRKRPSTIFLYASGNYKRIPETVLHYRGAKITVQSDDVFCIGVDGETYYDDAAEFEALPYAIDFVCPSGVDLSKIPLVRGRRNND